MIYFFSLILYRLLWLVLLPAALLALLLRSKNSPQYRHRMLERLGFLPPSFKPGGIVIHAASVGEVVALKNYIETLLTEFPETIITVTTFTPTGSQQVKKLFAGRVQHCYLPLDVYLANALFLHQLKPQALVFIETELWPGLIAQCASKNIKLMLINGRLSPSSMSQYQKIHWLIGPSLHKFSQILAQSEHHQANFIALGAEPQRCTVGGNLKYDIRINPLIADKLTQLRQQISSPRPVWLVASTHPGDDQLALAAFQQLKHRVANLLLVLVPRHPERFDEVANLCQQQQLTIVRRSAGTPVTSQHQVWLLDTLGELVAAYGLADIVTIAGTFSTIGGHNPLEAALFKKPIILGPDMANFTDILTQLQQANAVVPLDEHADMATALADAVHELLSDNKLQQTLGENAHRVVLTNQGASARAVNALKLLLGK